MSASSLRPINKGPTSKKEDLVRAFLRKFTTLLDDRPGIMSIDIS